MWVVIRVICHCVTFSWNTGKGGFARGCCDITVVVGVDKEGSFDPCSLEGIQDCVRVSVTIWAVIKCKGSSLQNTWGISTS